MNLLGRHGGFTRQPYFRLQKARIQKMREFLDAIDFSAPAKASRTRVVI